MQLTKTGKNVAKNAWKFLRPNENILIMAGIFFALSIVTAVTMVRNREQQFKGSVVYQNVSPEQLRQIQSIPEDARLGETDTNFKLTERIREANSVGLGLSMFLIHERISNNRVLNLEQTMKEFAKSDLLPPGAVVLLPASPTDYGMVRAALGVYFIRYSPAPLRLELLSSGSNGLADGPTFIIRLPDTSAAKMQTAAASSKVTSAGAWATLFTAPENVNHYIPAAFAPIETYTAMNWQISPLQQTELSAERVQELNTFLQRNN